MQANYPENPAEENLRDAGVVIDAIKALGGVKQITDAGFTAYLNLSAQPGQTVKVTRPST